MLAEVAPGVDVFSVIESWKGRLQLGNRDAPWESWRSLPQLNDPSGPDLAEDLQSLGSTSTGTGGFAEICAERLVQADIISTVGNVRQTRQSETDSTTRNFGLLDRFESPLLW